jgi:hypothetical protein
MPSLHQDARTSVYQIRFRYRGRQVNRSLRTKDRRNARAICDRVGEMLDFVDWGLVSVLTSHEYVQTDHASGVIRANFGRPTGFPR